MTKEERLNNLEVPQIIFGQPRGIFTTIFVGGILAILKPKARCHHIVGFTSISCF
jgi:hypothetical protein